MFIFSLKLTKRKIIITAVVTGFVLYSLISFAGSFGNSDINVSGQGEMNIESVEKIKVSYNGIKTNEDRVNFLKLAGWEVSEEAIDFKEVIIPQEFDDVYNNYNQIQKRQNLDLTKYKGKRVKCYTYSVLNHKNADSSVVANILIYNEEKIIGGDICSLKIDGFMHGFFESGGQLETKSDGAIN